MAIANFPTAIQTYPAIGVAGDKATLNPFVYTDVNPLAGDANIQVGRFVWLDPDNEPIPEHGSGIWMALSTGAEGVKPMGLVERNHSYFNLDVKDGGTLTVEEGARLQVVKFGDMYIHAATAATAGQKVFATLTDGSAQFGAAGATVAGAVETDFVVKRGGAADSLITVSSWEK